MNLRQPFIKVDAGTNTDAPTIEPSSKASVNPVEEIAEPCTKKLSNDEAFHNFQLGFISDIKEIDTELSLEGRRVHKETMLTFFTSNLHAVVKNLIEISKHTSVSDESIKRFSEFIKITVESKFESLYEPIKQAFEERIALREQINKLRNEWENLMEEKMSAVIAKDALLTAMPTRSNSFSQSSCQVQTEVISLNSNETQTYEKQTREIGTQAYLSDGFQNTILKSSKAIDKRWSFLTEAPGGVVNGRDGFSLRGQSFMSPNARVNPKKMKAMITKLIQEGYQANQSSKRKQWKYMLMQLKILQFWKHLSSRVLPANEKEAMEKARDWAMKRWRQSRTLAALERKEQQKLVSQVWKLSCDQALQLVRTTADISESTPKSERSKKSHKENQPKKSPWDRESARHAPRDIWNSSASPRGMENKSDGANGKSNDGWSAVTLSYHPVDFTNIRPTNYIKVSNIHKFNKPHFDPRAKRPHSSRIGKRALKKLSIQGLGGGMTNDNTEAKSNADTIADEVKENSPPQRRPASARVIKQKHVNLITNRQDEKAVIPPRKKQSEVGQPCETSYGSWLKAPIPTPKSTITFMKGQTKSQKRPKNTYGRSSGSMKRRKNKR